MTTTILNLDISTNDGEICKDFYTRTVDLQQKEAFQSFDCELCLTERSGLEMTNHKYSQLPKVITDNIDIAAPSIASPLLSNNFNKIQKNIDGEIHTQSTASVELDHIHNYKGEGVILINKLIQDMKIINDKSSMAPT